MDKITRIRQEIERLKRLLNDSNYYLDNSEQAVGYGSALDDLNEFVGNLSEEPDKSLEESARLYAIPHYMKDIDVHHIEEYPYDTGLEAAFKAGAEWMANQGISFEDKVYPTTDWKGDIDGYCIDGTEEIDLMSEAVPKGLFQVGDKVIVQIRKKEDEK